MPTESLDVAVLVASRWAALERFDTRWRRIAMAWAEDPRVRSLTIVDYPWWTSPLTPPGRLLQPIPSWLAGTTAYAMRVPSRERPALDPLAWGRVARRLRRVPADLVVATTPLVAPVLDRLRRPGVTTAFDGVDLWRMTNVGGFLPRRLAEGYRAGYRADVVTAVSDEVAADMRRQGAGQVHPVPNGVALGEYRAPADRQLPVELPSAPFAVYTGTVGHRLDYDLLESVARTSDVPLVLVGPAADAEHEARARSGPWQWTGSLPPEDLPTVLARASAALVPFRADLPIAAQDHMKLFQYLASGVPVVATPMSGLPPEVLVGEDAAGFAKQVGVAVTLPRATDVHPLLEGRDWSDVADRLLTLYTAARSG